MDCGFAFIRLKDDRVRIGSRLQSGVRTTSSGSTGSTRKTSSSGHLGGLTSFRERRKDSHTSINRKCGRCDGVNAISVKAITEKAVY